MSTTKQKAWVWFKGGLKKQGEWVGGFLAKEEQEGFVIERSDFVSCKVPKWRVKLQEPNNLKQGPAIPNNPKWKY